MKFHHDVHTHTHISSCSGDRLATPENYIRAAAELGHTTFGFSNHLWDETVEGENGWYHKQCFAHILSEKERIFSLDNCGMKILFGAEVEYCGKSDTLAIKAENASVLDYVLVPHTHVHMEGFVIPRIEKHERFRKEFKYQLIEAFPWMSEETAERVANSMKLRDAMPAIGYSREEYDEYVAEFAMSSYEKLLENPEFEKLTKTLPVIIAHPFSPAKMIKHGHRERLRKSFEKTARMGVAFDINLTAYGAKETLEDNDLIQVMREAKECGVKFTFGTDAHSVASLSTIEKGDDVADAIGITGDDIFELVK